ncbi:class I adenylate-forming enzyme family protein [Marinactinospora thermotolerans]|uniref:Acyl-CoA synthetase (AMP-forming)/AMP-acid ligase II n=1 Tax=Marinactinospora thermotolerans DSM 45154 TaxID=1122192 RepID=A0A1T4R8V0_9ACTN|nr:class I adenylate-forming enzyme family protein [Marinactinospora thermotolerans]SKA12355.1 Acyl-CoA synthetase (AMP-forming)/AMP-acid ligase II [Marinactinospora thermotolerans DSM 45154]
MVVHSFSSHSYPPSAAVPLEARRRLFADEDLGMGNFLDRVAAVHPAGDRPFLWTVARGGSPEQARPLSVEQLVRTRDTYAGWYHAAGVTKGDPVAVYLDDGVGYFLHFLALSSLGAVPALVNGRMPAPVAADYVARIGAVGVVATTGHLAALRDAGLDAGGLLWCADAAEIPAEPASGTALPGVFPYPHADPDPVMLCHTSGTTGPPKAAMFGHRQFFLGKRERLLTFPQAEEGNRLLTALPQSHSAGISYLMTATLLGLPTMVMTDNDGASVRAAMDRFEPTVVAAFPQTYVELAALDLSGPGSAQVHTWINTGDSAHEAHIRALVRYGRRPDGNGGHRPGSRFIDGLGSSEMGMALFRKVSEPESGDYGRCVGTPIDIVEEVAVLDDAGRPLGPGEPGRLGVRTPTVTPGYWNDSRRTIQSSYSGYWLTGDVVYRTEDGRIYHLDRSPDVIHTADGPVYSLPIEEVVLTDPVVDDCAVIAVPDPVAGDQAPFAVVRLRAGTPAPGSLLDTLNAALAEAGLVPLRGVTVAAGPDEFPTGPTGKVLKRRMREMYVSALAGSGVS